MLFFLGLLGAGAFPGKSGGPPGAGFPPGGAYPAGAKTVSFSAEKETVLDSKEKVRPVYGALLLRKRRLSSLRTVVRTSPGRYGHTIGEQRKVCGSILGPPGCSTLAAECGGAPGASRPTQVFYSAAREAPDRPGHERGTRRRRVDRAQACPCFTRAGRNGRKGSFLSYERRQPPFSTRNLP